MIGHLRVSNQGNLIQVVDPCWHKIIFNTSGMGNRSERKAIARAEMNRLCPPPPSPPPAPTTSSETAKAIAEAWRGPGTATAEGPVVTIAFASRG